MRSRLLALVGFFASSVLAGCGDDDPCLAPTPGMVCGIAGTGALGFNRDGLAPEHTDLYLPSAVRRGPDGRVYVMDFNNQRLRVIGASGVVETVMGTGFHAVPDEGSRAIDAPLENPIDFRFLADGRLVFVSYHDPRVLVLEHDGTIGRLAGHGELGVRGNEGDFESPLWALFIQLDGLAIAPDGTMYVSDSLANRVRMIRGGIIQTVAGNGESAYFGDGGPGVDAGVWWPTALELDAAGNLLIAESRNHVIRKLAPDGTISTIAGTGVQGFSGDGGPASAAQLDQPNGIAIDTDGTIYIADRGNFRIRRIHPSGTITTLAGTGIEGRTGDGGPALDARFGYIARIALDGDDLLVADQSNACARRITLRDERPR